MNYDQRPRWVRLAIRLALAVWVITTTAACPPRFTDFETGTVVEEDGAVTRFTRYAASHAEVDELRDRYVLPANGTWVRSRVKRVDPSDGKEYSHTVHVYTAIKRFAPGEIIPSDHRRLAESGQREVRNDIQLRVRDYFLARRFDFREELHDREGHALLIAEVEKAYPRWVDRVAEAIAKRLDGVSKDMAFAAVTDVSAPWVDKFLAGDPIESTAFDHLFDEESTFARAVLERLGMCIQAHTTAEDEISEAYSTAFEELVSEEFVEEVLFGVYSDVFSSTRYGVKQRLWIPGILLSSNAESTEAGALSWSIEADRLILQPQFAEASSLVLLPRRIAALLLAFGLVVVWGHRRRRRAEAKSERAGLPGPSSGRRGDARERR